MTIDLDELERIATAASETYLDQPWRRDGRTVWSGEWPTNYQAHPVCTYWIDADPRGMQAPPVGTTATLDHIVAFQPRVALELVHLLKHSRMINQQLLDNVCDAHEERDRLRALLREALDMADVQPDLKQLERVGAIRKEAGL